jgi:adenine specific DNA methylase Mod
LCHCLGGNREKGVNSFTIWDFVDTATKGTKELMKLFNGKKFATPKPEKLLQRIIHIATKKGLLFVLGLIIS